MKRTRLFVTVFLALGLLWIFTISAAMAQPPPMFDDVWFKLNVKVKGYRVDPVSGTYERYNFRITAYVYFTYDSGGPIGINPITYNYVIVTEQAPGIWNTSYVDTEDTILTNENFFPDFYFYLAGEGGSWIHFYHTPFIKIRTDSFGAFLKASYKAYGEVFGGNDGAGNEIYGSCVINGKSIDPSMLPFPL